MSFFARLILFVSDIIKIWPLFSTFELHIRKWLEFFKMIVYYYLNYKEFVYEFPIFRLIFLGTEKQFYANWIIKSEELTQFGWNQNESKIQWHLFIDFNEIFKISFPQKITDVCDWWFKYHSDQFLIWRINKLNFLFYRLMNIRILPLLQSDFETTIYIQLYHTHTHY